MSQGEQEGSSYILIQHKNHQWIERLDGPNRLPSRYSYYDETAKVVEELNRLADRIKQLEAVVNDPEALWANWLRGTVKLPSGIGDVRQYQDRIKRLEDCAETAWGIIANVDSGNWQEQRADWREAAARWRDERFHPELSECKATEDKP